MKHEFELRKIIIGLCSIFRTDPALIPPEVGQGLPAISSSFFTGLLAKMVKLRKEMQEEEEKDIDEQENKLKGVKEDREDEEADGEEEHDQKDLDDSEGDDDDSDDGDFELEGGDMVLYDSALDDLDELVFAKETLEGLKNGRQEYF